MTTDWTYYDAPIGPCAVCHEPCRSTEPDGTPRHPNCDDDPLPTVADLVGSDPDFGGGMTASEYVGSLRDA